MQLIGDQFPCLGGDFLANFHAGHEFDGFQILGFPILGTRTHVSKQSSVTFSSFMHAGTTYDPVLENLWHFEPHDHRQTNLRLRPWLWSTSDGGRKTLFRSPTDVDFIMGSIVAVEPADVSNSSLIVTVENHTGRQQPCQRYTITFERVDPDLFPQTGRQLVSPQI